MTRDVLADLVRLLAAGGREVAASLGDPGSRESLMAQAGLVAPTGGPPPSQSTVAAFDALSARAAGDESGSSLALIRDLSDAMLTLVAFVQEAAATDSEDDAWNKMAAFLDLIAIGRLRSRQPGLIALLQALHLVADDRLLIADAIRSREQWGSFLLGHPPDDEAKADNWSLILGAALAALGWWIPPEDETGKFWRTDMLFGWDPEPSPAHPHAARVLERMATVRLTAREAGFEESAGLSAVVVPPADGGWGIFFALELGAGLTFPIGSHLELELKADVPNEVNAFFGDRSFAQAGLVGANARLLLRRKKEVAEAWRIEISDKIHLEIGTFLTGIELGDPTRFCLQIGDGAIVMPRGAMGGFLGSALPSDGAEFAFDVDLAVDTRGRLAFAGGGGMTVTVPVNKSIAGLAVRNVTVALAIEDGPKGAAASLGVTVAFSAAFGPAFRVVVDRVGAKSMWTLPPSPANESAPVVPGNLGTAGDLSLDFVAPRGIGVSLNVGRVRGGGFLFFDPPRRTYAGVLEASLTVLDTGVQLKAAGLLRENDESWSFMLIFSAQFDPKIELLPGLFPGWTLNGVGGMAGINVGVDPDKLRAGLHDGAVGRLLFPEDPVANAPAIVETMAAVFPPRQGGWAAGVMLQLGWGRPNSFVTLSLAIVLARPSPALNAILGRLRLVAPVEDFGIIDIKADFFGTISFEEPAVTFDAALVDSKIAAFALTGDIAMRAGPEGFILLIGGFHPDFSPPANVPAMRRVAVDISANSVTKIRAEAYVAVTSNTFQIGLHADLDIEAGRASIHGWLDFDTQVSWEPRFRFKFKMAVTLELRISGKTMAGVSVDLLLEGPGPWHAKGDASLHLFFFTVHAGFEVTWGEVEPARMPPEVDAASIVAQALSIPGAWRPSAPAGDALVTFRTVDREAIGVHPYGQLSVRQQAVPLGVPVSRIGLSRVRGGTATVVVTPVAGTVASTPTMGQFASSQFQELSDDERLSRPSFESFQDGVAFGASGTVLSSEQATTATYETVFIPDAQRRRDRLDLGLLVHALEVGATARAGLHSATLRDGPDQRVRLADTRYRVVSADTLAAAPAAFGSATAAYEAARAAGDRVTVVEAHEVAG